MTPQRTSCRYNRHIRRRLANGLALTRGRSQFTRSSGAAPARQTIFQWHLRRENWGQIGLTCQRVPEFSENGIQRGERDLCRSRDFDPDRLTIGREIDDQTRFDPTGSHALLIRFPREVEVRGDRSAMPKRHLKIALFHDCA